MGIIVKPVGQEWYIVDWLDVWQAKRLAPESVPGVVPQLDGLRQREAPHFPTRIHRTHLALLDCIAPGAASPTCQPPPATPGVVLRPHQVVGIDYIRSRRGTLLADEQRVGKSPQVMYAHDPSDGPLVVIGPLAARAVWHEWASRRFGMCRSGVVDGGKGDPCSICWRANAPKKWAIFEPDAPSFIALTGRKFDEVQLAHALRARVIFLHFAIMPTWRELFARLPKIGTLAVDEAHMSGVQNRNGLFFESVRFFNTVAAHSVFMTGTPVTSKPSGLWSMLDVLTPGAFGPFWDFARRYCDARPGSYGWTAKGATNLDELSIRLREVMLRRTWAEVAPSMPPITRNLEIVRLGDSVRDKVEALAAQIRAESNGATIVGDLSRLRKLYANEKVGAAVEHLKGLGASSCIAWTWHRDVSEALARSLRGAGGLPDHMVIGPIHGDMPPNEREELIEIARASVRPVVFVATMAALGTAVNLSFATHELFVELHWEPTPIAQAEMRPFDGTKPIAATYLVADCEVEQKLADSLIAKLEVQGALGLRAGVGSVQSVLTESLGIEDAQTLSELADAICVEAAI